MSPLQIAILALVFVVVVAGMLGVSALLRPNAARRQLEALVGEHTHRPLDLERWLDRVAAFTRPVSKLSAPEEGFEQSSIRLRFMHAGIRSAAAAPAYFGIKTLLTLGLPMGGFALLTLAGSPLKGNGLLMAMLGLAALGYYGPNMVLSRMVFVRQREIFECFPDALDRSE